MKKAFVTGVFTLLASLSLVINTLAGEWEITKRTYYTTVFGWEYDIFGNRWQETETKCKYREDDGSYVKACHREIDGKRYHFNEEGVSDGGECLWPSYEGEMAARKISDEIYASADWNGGTPIIVIPHGGAYFGETTASAIELVRDDEGVYRFTIYVSLADTNPRAQKGFQGMCYLIKGNDNSLYEFLIKDYKDEILQPDAWVPTSYGFSVMVHEGDGELNYYIKLQV